MMAPPVPREHGAWAMLYTPFLVTVLILGTFDIRVLLLLICVTATFFAHEPLSILARLKPDSTNASKRRRNAVRWVTVYAVMALATSLPLVISYRRMHLIPLGLCVFAFQALHGRLIGSKTDRSVPGEILGIVTLTATAPIAYYVLQGAWDFNALLLWLLHIFFFVSSIFYVKILVGRYSKKKDHKNLLLPSATYHSALLLSLALLIYHGAIPALILVAYLPILIRTAMSFRPGKNHLNLRRVGFTEMAFTMFFLLLTVLAFRS